MENNSKVITFKFDQIAKMINGKKGDQSATLRNAVRAYKKAGGKIMLDVSGTFSKQIPTKAVLLTRTVLEPDGLLINDMADPQMPLATKTAPRLDIVKWSDLTEKTMANQERPLIDIVKEATEKLEEKAGKFNLAKFLRGTGKKSQISSVGASDPRLNKGHAA